MLNIKVKIKKFLLTYITHVVIIKTEKFFGDDKVLSPEDKVEIIGIVRDEALSDKHMNQIEGVFVTRKECNATTEDLNKKLGQDFADLAVIKFQNKMILGILAAVGVAVLGLVIKQFWG